MIYSHITSLPSGVAAALLLALLLGPGCSQEQAIPPTSAASIVPQPTQSESLRDQCKDLLAKNPVPTQAALDLMYEINPRNLPEPSSKFSACYHSLRDRLAVQGQP